MRSSSSRSRVVPPSPPALGVTQDPPSWFKGPPQEWQGQRQRFERATRLDMGGAQHVAVGAGLVLLGGGLLMNVVPVPANLLVLTDGAVSTLGWALMVTAALAMMVGNHLRGNAQRWMMAALWLTLRSSDNPLVTGPVGQDPDADQGLAIEAHDAARRSPRGSFDELVNAMVEARMLGGVVVAPMRWMGGMVFRTMVPLAVVTTVPGAVPPQEPRP